MNLNDQKNSKPLRDRLLNLKSKFFSSKRAILLLALAFILITGCIIWDWPQIRQLFTFLSQVNKANAAMSYDIKGMTDITTANPGILQYTVSAGAKVLVVGLAIRSINARGGGDPTYANITMTKADQTRAGAAEVSVEMWYLLNPPTASSSKVRVPNNGGLIITIMASSYAPASGKDVALDIAGGNTGASKQASTTLVTLADGDVIVDVMAHGNSFVENSCNQTSLYATDEGVWDSGAQYALQTSAGSIIMSHVSRAVDNFGIVAAAFKEVGTDTALPDSEILIFQ